MPTGSRSPARQTQAGFSYLFVLMLIALIGMGLAAAGTWWQTDAQRTREAELLFIGDQYRQAIKHYYEFDPAQPRLPESVDNLLADNRRPNPARHLRRAWRDPVSGVAFVLIQSADGKGIQGVHSPSTQTPLKTAGFDAPYEDFSKASSYADWRFVFIPPAPAVQSPAATGNAPK
jgi:type II secretory pathway pseudopilin PulG